MTTTTITKYMLDYALKREYPNPEDKFEETFEYKIKFKGKNSMIIGNPEGMSIEHIIKKSNDSSNIDIEKDNIVVLGNIIGSTFSKNPLLTQDYGEDDSDKLKTYYSNIIKMKSHNNANIEFCNKDNVTFIMGNRELDLIKIKDLVELKSGNYGENTIEKYLQIRNVAEFKIESLKAFYPFWVKYYFKDSYTIPDNFKFIKRFKKIFKSIDAEMLLFTLYYESNINNDALLDELTLLAISYFYNMKTEIEKHRESTESEPSTISTLGEFTTILDKLDYLAFYVFQYFSTKNELYNLIKKADFILQLKVSNSYYLLSHGGITEDMFDKKSSDDNPIPNPISKINDFINSHYDKLTDSSKIKKKDNDKIIELHNKTKEEQAKYYNDLIKSKECKIDITEEIEFKALDDLNTKITDSYHYNLLLLNSLHRKIGAINEQLKPPGLTGGFVGQQKSKWSGFRNDVKDFKNDTIQEIEKYNSYLKNIVEKLLDEGVVDNTNNDDKPSKNLLLILMLAHSFNSRIFKTIYPSANLGNEKFKSKNYSVLINTVFDHRAKHNVPYRHVHQIIANSNNTAQTTEAIYDAIFFGTVIDCYETIVQARHHEKNYLISIDNSAIIKHYSYFDSVTCLYIEPNIKDIFNINQMAIKTQIQKRDLTFIIFQTLENIYKVLNHRIKEQKLTMKAKIKESLTKSTYFGNLICQSMNYYGINKANEIIFSESKIIPIKFRSYKF